MDDGIEDITEATAAAQIAAAQNQFGNGASANGGQKEYGYGGVDLVKAPQTLKTIEDALMSVANECKKDNFWRDMARPADQAVARFKRMALTDDADEKAKLRAEGMEHLEFFDKQLENADKAGLFKQEYRMVNLVVKHLKENQDLQLSSPLNALAAAERAARGLTEMQSARDQMQSSAQAQRSIAQVREHMRPYTFHCSQDDNEMTVTIKVPPETKMADCVVEIKRETLKVCVKGHALQPSVIDGKLLYPIDQTMSQWHLEGSGDTRVLILDLENTHAGVDWSKGLLVVGAAAK
jgi:hypothetical protein